jgi:hypothetical protein
MVINEVEQKQILIKEYNRLISKYSEQRILRYILKDQGKEMLTREVLSKNITLEDMIFSEEYYITNMDLIILSSHFKLPVIIMANRRLLELKDWLISNKLNVKAVNVTRENRHLLNDDKYKFNRKLWIVPEKTKQPFYYFIKQYGIKRNIVLKYGLLQKNNSIRFEYENINKSLKSKIIEVYSKRPSFDKFIEKYVVRADKKTNGKKQKLLLEIEKEPQPEKTSKSKSKKSSKRGTVILDMD